ncbi:MAG: bifunctional riboflavin kinase/FAD synthetase [Balneolaceae bacterium]
MAIVELNDVRRDPDTILTVGTFDGVHAGHRVLVNTVLQKAKSQNTRSAIVTFDPHPRDIISPGRGGIRLLTTLEERAEVLQELGIDDMIVIPFTRDFSLLGSDEFVRKIIWEKIGVQEFVIGYDHQFGKDRQGSIQTIQDLSKELGFRVHIVSKQEVDNHTVSSTAIRNALQNDGNVELATTLLQRNYFLNGTVVHGEKRGSSIGFPTANIQPSHPNKSIPKNGVYAVRVRVDGTFFGGMMNIGIRPTFYGTDLNLEVHIFKFNKDIYGETVQVRFIKRVRDEQKFSGIDQLRHQLEKDREKCHMILEADHG